MAAMSTVLTVFSDQGNQRTFTYTGHSALDPRVVIQSRKVATGNTSVIEDRVQVISGTEDAANIPLASRVVYEAKLRRPVNGAAADVSAALAIFRDIVASDEFGTLTTTQKWLK